MEDPKTKPRAKSSTEKAEKGEKSSEPARKSESRPRSEAPIESGPRRVESAQGGGRRTESRRAEPQDSSARRTESAKAAKPSSSTGSARPATAPAALSEMDDDDDEDMFGGFDELGNYLLYQHDDGTVLNIAELLLLQKQSVDKQTDVLEKISKTLIAIAQGLKKSA